MIVDLAHLNNKSFFEVLDYCKGYDKLIYSHGCCRSLCDHVRNMTDDMLYKLKENGGVVGINYCHDFVIEEDKHPKFKIEAYSIYENDEGLSYPIFNINLIF